MLIFYRACPSEFVIPLAKYRKSIYNTQLSVGMRFGMMFETEESGKRRYIFHAGNLWDNFLKLNSDYRSSSLHLTLKSFHPLFQIYGHY